MKKLLLLFVLVAAMSACTHKTQPATVVAEDSVVVVENVADTTAVGSIVLTIVFSKYGFHRN